MPGKGVTLASFHARRATAVKLDLWQKLIRKRKCWPMACATNPKSRGLRSRQPPLLVPRPCPVFFVASIAPVRRWSHARSWASRRLCAHRPARRRTRLHPDLVKLSMLTAWLKDSPRSFFVLVCLGCLGMLAFGQYLQHVVGLEPCPMCIVQRYAAIVVAIIAGLTSISGRRAIHLGGAALLLPSAGFGAYVAARQSWLQWYPPEVVSCGRDFYGMIETFPLQRAIPMIFRGGGDCSKIDWTFLGGSIANWSFVCFSAFAALTLGLIWQQSRNRHS